MAFRKDNNTNKPKSFTKITIGLASPEEILEQCQEAVESMDPRINALYYKAFEEARNQIREGIDLEAPFAGVPILMKDAGGMVKGFPYSGGSRLMEGCICRKDKCQQR